MAFENRNAFFRNPLKVSERAPEQILPRMQNYESQTDAARLLSKYGFYFSIAVFVYADLFPFSFDFSWNHLLQAWSQVKLIPYWDYHNGMQIVPDDLANILLTLPLGFTGFLYRKNKSWPVLRWLALGLACGFAAELSQLAILTRASTVSDAINNGLGAFLGAAAACLIGRRALEFFTGAASERRNIYLWLVIWCLVAMLGPYEFGRDYVLHIRSGLLMIRDQPVGHQSLYGEEWLRMAGFALIGALAVRLAVPGRRKRTIWRPTSAAAIVLLLPVTLHGVRLLTESRPPSLDDLVLNIFAVLAGAFVSLFIPPILHALSGFLLFTVALIIAGLSPYSFSGWHKSGPFQWIPFYEFCANRTPASFYELVLIFVSFGILGGFLGLSFPRWRQWHVVAYSMCLSALIEFAQTFLPARTAGTGAILLAGIGALTGAYVCAAVQSARLDGRLFLRRTQDFSKYVM